MQVGLLELLDTTFLIDLVNNDSGALAKAKDMDMNGIVPVLSVISSHEYLFGVHLRYRNDKKVLSLKLAGARRDLGSFEMLPLTQEITELSAEIHASLSAKGEIIGINDIYVGATALYHNLRLITRDVLHFERINGLRVGNY